jgi:AraC-like DNA-binding protein
MKQNSFKATAVEQTERLSNESYLPSSSISVMYDTFPEHIQLHWHEFYEIHFIDEGEGIHILNGNTYPLRKGSLFLLTPVDFHEILPKQDHPLGIYNIIFSDDMIGDDLRKILFGSFESLTTILQGESMHQLESDISRLHREFSQRKPGYELVLKGTFERILVDLARTCRVRADRPLAVDKCLSQGAIQKALIYMHLHFPEALTLKDVANQAQLSANYFSVCFHKVTGQCFQKYLQELRLRFSRTLLRTANCSVTEVCYASGFNTLSHFERVFKERFRQSPGNYQQRSCIRLTKPS